jgi:hypothetical protein
MRTPIALFIFKRPHTTQKVFDVIRQVKPKQLFVVADAPHPNEADEAEKCAAARAIIDQVDWDCDIIKRYADTNVGLGGQLSTGISWVFDQVEEAILLEDDCLVHPDFFRFAEELLEYYRNDPRIFSISSQNVQLKRNRTQDSYYFSRYHHIWGWATWRRAWQHYDYTMKLWPKVRETSFLRDLLGDRGATQYWTDLFQATYEGEIHTWDYQWTLTCWLQRGLSIIPNVNLVNHIGFWGDSTNAHYVPKVVKQPLEPLNFPLHHPAIVMPWINADRLTQKEFFESGSIVQLKRRIKRLLKSQLPAHNWKFS